RGTGGRGHRRGGGPLILEEERPGARRGRRGRQHRPSIRRGRRLGRGALARGEVLVQQLQQLGGGGVDLLQVGGEALLPALLGVLQEELAVAEDLADGRAHVMADLRRVVDLRVDGLRLGRPLGHAFGHTVTARVRTNAARPRAQGYESPSRARRKCGVPFPWRAWASKMASSDRAGPWWPASTVTPEWARAIAAACSWEPWPWAWWRRSGKWASQTAIPAPRNRKRSTAAVSW